jgi:ATP-binding cassette subfamily D (ALD) protein 3
MSSGDLRPSFTAVPLSKVLISILRTYYGKRRMVLTLAIGTLGLQRLLGWQARVRSFQKRTLLQRSLSKQQIPPTPKRAWEESEQEKVCEKEVEKGSPAKQSSKTEPDKSQDMSSPRRRKSSKDGEIRTSKSAQDTACGKKKAPVKVDSVFLARLVRLLPVLVPGWRSKESLLLFSKTAVLVARSLLSLHISELMGKGLQSVARRSPELFLSTLSDFFISGIFASAANSALKYMGNLMSTWFRENLTREVHRAYMNNRNYYQAAVLMQAGSQQSRLDNLDQRIVADLHNFTKMLADLYSRTFKPALDVFLCTRAMAQTLSVTGPLIMYSYFIVTTFLLRIVSPPLAKLTAQQQAIEGDFRHCHARLLAHAEEVAFISGAEREEEILNEQLLNVSSFSEYLHLKQFQQGMLDSFGLKYFASCIGWPVIAVPFILYAPGDDQVDMIARYRVADDLIRQGSAALGDLLMVYKKLQTLSGYTARVSELVEALDAMSHASRSTSPNDFGTLASTAIAIEDAKVETPDGRMLISNLSMQLRQGESLLVTGPNGAGKSSLFRVLAGLWPCKEGRIKGPDPAKREVLYLPQTPYLVMGTLRDQVIYPDTPQEAAKKYGGKPQVDESVQSALRAAGLERLASGNLDLMHREWDDVLSGGEKQRMGWARLFFHSPAFAALDEATSAVNVQQEGPLYQEALDRNIMLLSIAHRPTVRRFHQWELNVVGDGTGKCMLSRIEPEVTER